MAASRYSLAALSRGKLGTQVDSKVALGLAFLLTVPALAVMGVGRAGLTIVVRWHRLDLPGEWAAPVIRYLRTARRFRIWGAVLGAVLLVPWQLSEQRIGVDFLAASAGWLIGGALLELRLGRTGTAAPARHPLPRWPCAYGGRPRPSGVDSCPPWSASCW